MVSSTGDFAETMCLTLLAGDVMEREADGSAQLPPAKSDSVEEGRGGVESNARSYVRAPSFYFTIFSSLQLKKPPTESFFSPSTRRRRGFKVHDFLRTVFVSDEEQTPGLSSLSPATNTYCIYLFLVTFTPCCALVVSKGLEIFLFL